MGILSADHDGINYSGFLGLILEGSSEWCIFSLLFRQGTERNILHSVGKLLLSIGSKPTAALFNGVDCYGKDDQVDGGDLTAWELHSKETEKLITSLKDIAVLASILEWTHEDMLQDLVVVKKGKIDNFYAHDTPVIEIKIDNNLAARLVLDLDHVAETNKEVFLGCKLDGHCDTIIGFSFEPIDSKHIKLLVYIDGSQSELSIEALTEAVRLEICNALGGKIFELLHVTGLTECSATKIAFSRHLNDQLISSKEYSGIEDFNSMYEEDWAKETLAPNVRFAFERESSTTTGLKKFAYATIKTSAVPVVLSRLTCLFFFSGLTSWTCLVESARLQPEGTLKSKNLPSPRSDYYELVIFFGHNKAFNMSLKKIMADFMLTCAPSDRIADGVMKVADETVPVLVFETDGYYAKHANFISESIRLKTEVPFLSAPVAASNMHVFSALYDELRLSCLGRFVPDENVFK